MDFSHTFLLFFLFILPTLSTAQSCSISKCMKDNFGIRFPFRIPELQPARCGYPGFNLACNDAGVSTLNLSSSEQFLVRNIDYVAQQIQLYDPDVCLPKRLLLQGFNFNLSNSPFLLPFSKNFTFLSCLPQFATSRFPVLSCLGNSTSSVVATSSMSYVRSMSKSNSCKIIANLTVPVAYPDEANQFLTDHYGDLLLTWNSPACSICETEGRLCGFKSNSGLGIACFNKYSTGENNGLRILRIICVVIILPSLMCVFGFGCFICFARWGYGIADSRRNQAQNQQQVNPALETEPPIRLSGLDESTIDSYQKVILGESRRLPGPNGTTCPICLGEYLTKDTVRCIPECKHCFHVDCIDQWLRVNSSCPLCRNSPSPSPSH
ncbi:putative RING-H2 finger protein ATL21A, partial [Cucurbita argyrosperma subsp. sororia]